MSVHTDLHLIRTTLKISPEKGNEGYAKALKNNTLGRAECAVLSLAYLGYAITSTAMTCAKVFIACIASPVKYFTGITILNRWTFKAVAEDVISTTFLGAKSVNYALGVILSPPEEKKGFVKELKKGAAITFGFKRKIKQDDSIKAPKPSGWSDYPGVRQPGAKDTTKTHTTYDIHNWSQFRGQPGYIHVESDSSSEDEDSSFYSTINVSNSDPTNKSYTAFNLTEELFGLFPKIDRMFTRTFRGNYYGATHEERLIIETVKKELEELSKYNFNNSDYEDKLKTSHGTTTYGKFIYKQMMEACGIVAEKPNLSHNNFGKKKVNLFSELRENLGTRYNLKRTDLKYTEEYYNKLKQNQGEKTQ